MKNQQFTLLSAFLLFGCFVCGITSCKKDQEESHIPALPNANNNELQADYLGSAYAHYAGGPTVRVELYALKKALTGYNTIYIALFDSTSRKRITDADLVLKANWEMGGLKSSAMVENVEKSQTPGIYTCGVAFPEWGSWKLNVKVFDKKSQETAEANMNVKVSLNGSSTMLFIPQDSVEYGMVFLSSKGNKVGSNEFVVWVNRKVNDDYVAAEDMSISAEAVMPLDTNSSTGLKPLQHIGKGRYINVLNFNQKGYWQIKLTVKKGNTVISNYNTQFQLVL